MKRNILLQNYSNLTSQTSASGDTPPPTPKPTGAGASRHIGSASSSTSTNNTPISTSIKRGAVANAISSTSAQSPVLGGTISAPPIILPMPMQSIPVNTTPSLGGGGGGGGDAGTQDNSNQTTNPNKMTTTNQQMIAGSIGAAVGAIAGWLIGKKGNKSGMFALIGAGGLGATAFFAYPKFAPSKSAFVSENYKHKESNFNANEFEPKSGVAGVKDGDKSGGDCYLHGAWQKCPSGAASKTISAKTLSKSGALSNSGASRNL